MKKVICFLFITLTADIMFSQHLIASELSQNTQEYTLGEIVVSDTKLGVEAVGTNRTITAEDIEISGAGTLDEAIRLLPGLSLKTGGAGTPRIDIRGLRSRHIVLLLDGIPFNSTNDGQFDPTLIPVENIAKIKVSYGSNSVLYGDGGLAGVINIITKKGTPGIQVSAAAEAGERNRWLEKFSLSGGSETVNFFLSGSASDTDGYPLSNDFDDTPYEDGDLRDNSDRERNSLFANVGMNPTDNLNIGVVLNYFTGEYGIPTGVLDSRQDPFASNQKYERVDDLEGFSTQLSASYDIPGPADIRGSVFMNRMEEEDNQYDDATYSTQEDLTINGLYHKQDETLITGGYFQAHYSLNAAGDLAFGFATRKEEFDSDGKIVEKKGKPFVYFSEEWDTQTHSASCEYEIYPIKLMGIVLGYSHHWFKKDIGDDQDKGAYLIGTHYDITETTRIRASFAKKIRFPSIRQLYDKATGNPDLSEEKANNYEVGASQRIGETTELSLTGFYQDVDDYIEKDDGPYENHDEYRFQGVELSVETRTVKNLLLRTSYTYMESEDKSPGSEKDELQYRPEHKLTLEGKYDFMYGFSAYASLLHESNQYTYSRKSPLIKREMNDYTIFDTRLEKSFLTNKLTCYVGVDNLFDEDYEESYGLPREGRTVYGGIRVTH
ncbi:MAG: TonB-dependent receptor [Desulfobacterales bacterium]|jgi:outer membrane cobalamin receptor|nr:TonB-dependent receptor [Desulfobacterales bacterium]